jgi:hypothetical protein
LCFLFLWEIFGFIHPDFYNLLFWSKVYVFFIKIVQISCLQPGGIYLSILIYSFGFQVKSKGRKTIWIGSGFSFRALSLVTFQMIHQTFSQTDKAFFVYLVLHLYFRTIFSMKTDPGMTDSNFNPHPSFFTLKQMYKPPTLYSLNFILHPLFFTLHSSTLNLTVEVGVWHQRNPFCLNCFPSKAHLK